jgi:hypothetical protein
METRKMKKKKPKALVPRNTKPVRVAFPEIIWMTYDDGNFHFWNSPEAALKAARTIGEPLLIATYSRTSERIGRLVAEYKD